MILFVCTGNTCRSPMAAALFRREWQKRPAVSELKIASAGLAAADGDEVSGHVRTLAQEAGIELDQCCATPLEGAEVERACLILVMTRQHRRQLQRRFPGAADKIFLLKERAGLTGDPDVADPYGGSLEEYRRVFEEIGEAVAAIVLDLERSRFKDGNCIGQ